MSSDLDQLRRELTDLRAYVQSLAEGTTSAAARSIARERTQEARRVERLLAAGPLDRIGFPTREGTPNEPNLTAPLAARMRSDYATPAGELDRLNLSVGGVFDDTYECELLFTLPGTAYDVYEAYFGVSLSQFFATATGAASGGSSTPTSGASSASTTAAGGANTPTSGASSSSTTNSGGGSTQTSTSNAQSSSSSTTNSGGANHVHRWGNWVSDTPGGYATRKFTDGGVINFDLAVASSSNLLTEDVGTDHTHGMSHTHSHSHDVTIPNHTHGMAHTHDVDIPNHTHGMAHTHDVTIPSHTHGLVYGIFREAMPATWTVQLRVYQLVAGAWTLRVTVAAFLINALTGEYDLTNSVSWAAGMWKIALMSAGGQPNNGRLTAQMYARVVGAIRTP